MNSSALPVVVVGGGQSGLAAARAALDAGLRPIILESGDRPAGSWPRYYDSLTLFSPARYSAFPDFPFSGEPDAYPARDEVVDHLTRYAASLDAEIRTGTRVTSVAAGGDAPFTVHAADGEPIAAAGVVAASGSFGNPYIPTLPGQESFTGETLHVADYRNPTAYAGRRVVVVGGGNSAIQVGYELAKVAEVTLATRSPIHFTNQVRLGQDLHYWLKVTGLDLLPPAWLARLFKHTLVLDTGDYRAALESGMLDRRPMFTGFHDDGVIWSDGSREAVDVVLFATGYRPHLDYLQGLGALDENGAPLHDAGISRTHPGLVYVGLEFQRSFSSNTLRGVHRDAEYVMKPLAAMVADAGSAITTVRAAEPQPSA